MKPYDEYVSFEKQEEPLKSLGPLFEELAQAVGAIYSENYHGQASRRIDLRNGTVHKSLIISPVISPEKFLAGLNGLTYRLTGIITGNQDGKSKMWSQTFEEWEYLPANDAVHAAVKTAWATVSTVKKGWIPV